MARCPVCGGPLKEPGYPDPIGYQSYECPEGCDFGDTWSWRARSMIKFVGAVLILAFFVIFIHLPLYVLAQFRLLIEKIGLIDS